MYEYEFCNSIIEFEEFYEHETFSRMMRLIQIKLIMQTYNKFFTIPFDYVSYFLKTAELLGIPTNCYEMSQSGNNGFLISSYDRTIIIVNPRKLRDYLENV